MVIVCGHVRRQSRVGGECQGVGIIADSIFKGIKTSAPATPALTPPPLMKMKFYDPSSSLTAGLLMSFQQGGGWVVEEEEWGWMVDGEGGVIAPDAHTPTPTNYHCVIENKEEVKTEAHRTQISQFVCFSPQRREKEGGREDSTGDR